MSVRIAVNEEDEEQKFTPSVRYLQKLGPEHIDQIFNSSRWILQENEELGFQVLFTAIRR
jgi:Vam6/Vps39-like protein vacuolar protein sorting-associated protein 39